MKYTLSIGTVALLFAIAAAPVQAKPLSIVPGTAQRVPANTPVAQASPATARVGQGSSQPAVALFSSLSAGGTTTDTAVAARTFVPMDRQRTIVCPGPNICRIEALTSANIADTSGATNRFAFCTTINGTFAASGCAFLGELPASENFVQGTVLQSTSQLQPGSYTVQTLAYVQDGTAQFGLHTTNYTLYDQQIPASGAAPTADTR